MIKTFLAGLVLLLIIGCEQSRHTLVYETRHQPIQLGPHLSSVPADSIGSVSGSYSHFHREPVESESGRIRLGEFESEGVDFDGMFMALEADPRYFISDGKYVTEVRYGISLFTILVVVLFDAVSSESANMGVTEAVIIEYEGTLYQIPETE